MDKKSKILLWVLGFLIIASVGVTYWRIMIKRDYIIESQVDCDPYVEKCFVWQCDPESSVEGEACTGDSESDIWYFQVANRNAAKIPLCDPDTDESCDPWTCEENEKDCSVVFCDETNMADQYAASCNDPAQYTIDNPAEEESVTTCEEGNEECLAAQEETTCDLEVDPTCADDAATTDENGATDATATDIITTDNADTTGN